MVALSHETARELGHAPAPDSEDARKPFVEVSGRKGLGVKADDLIDTLIEKAAAEVVEAQPRVQPPTTRSAWRGSSPWRRCATSWSSSRAARSSPSTSTRRSASRARAGPTSSTPWCAPTTSCRSCRSASGVAEAGARRLARRPAAGGTRRRQRLPRGVGLVARGRAARRRGRAGRPHARVLGPGEVRVLAGAVVQRLLPPRARS